MAISERAVINRALLFDLDPPSGAFLKAAVSIPDAAFERVERLARRTKRSRNRIFSDALNEYLARHTSDELTERTNAVVAQELETSDAFVAVAAQRALEHSQEGSYEVAQAIRGTREVFGRIYSRIDPINREREMNLVMCLSLILAVASPTPEILGDVVGDNGKAAPGVTISIVSIPSSLEAAKMVSRADGSFDFTGLASGNYGVEARTKSACAMSNAVSVHVGFTTAVHLRLIKGFCSSAFS